ncbi:GNAT family N-acetyltransferase [Altibacter sp. HG106]|uniref:GNAT family N-acetyltransferase n=1 Tax=Altibacter sp. HG106 TaxID=3023937 RepID=UPI0023509EF8|nr:GNAT family N-acetyltransferase [Altibacter sp. HG106]MDC7995649.1 GNAT family N-acetyltransferase [Altibacter sp. HG106]
MKFQTFETERLYLKPTSREDAAFIFELLNCPKWIRYIGDRKVSSIPAAEAYIQERMLPQLERLGFSNYTLTTKEGNDKIGTCGLYDREGISGVDIGFAFLPQYEKKGYAFEAASKMKEVALSVFGIKRISAITTHDNHDSKRLLEKLGFQQKGVVTLPEDSEALLLYEIHQP